MRQIKFDFCECHPGLVVYDCAPLLSLSASSLLSAFSLNFCFMLNFKIKHSVCAAFKIFEFFLKKIEAAYFHGYQSNVQSEEFYLYRQDDL